MIRKFEITTSPHGMKAIQIDPTPEERTFLKKALMSNMTDCIFCQKKQIASPFLQSDQENFMLIEFWKPEGAEEFIEFLNSEHPEVLKAKALSVASNKGP